MSKKIHNEKGVKAAVKKLLDQHNWFWWMPAANGYGRVGIADINALRGGVFLAIETKFGSNKPTEMQKGFLTSVAAEDGIALVVNEQRIDMLGQWLAAFDRATQAVAAEQKPADEDGALMLDTLREMQREFV